MNRLLNKYVLVTGASRGIGKAITTSFIEEGAIIIANYKDKDELEGINSLLGKFNNNSNNRIFPIQADLSEENEIEGMFKYIREEIGQLDVLVNNAGICEFKPIDLLTLKDWQSHFNVNLFGLFICCKFSIKLMKDNSKKGSIISIGSVGSYFGNEFQAHYNASKAAVGSLMRSISVTQGQYGIRANTILPGCILTSINDEFLSLPGRKESLKNRIPLRRLGIPNDVVGIAIYLASDESTYCNGAEIVIDGGISNNI